MYKTASRNAQIRVEKSRDGRKRGLNSEEKRRLKKQRKDQERKIINEVFSPGSLVRGKVAKTMNFGANVDVCGVWCFIHISEISNNRISHPLEILRKNVIYNFKVIEKTWKEGKPSIKLTRKHLE